MIILNLKIKFLFFKMLIIMNYIICFRHIPKAKHTTVAETPELKRIAENTKLQSNVSQFKTYFIN